MILPYAVVAWPDVAEGRAGRGSANGAFGKLPEGAVNTLQNRSGCSPHSGMIPKSSARVNRTANTTMNTIRRTSRRRATSR
jgi:hypothetical protein